MNLLLLNDNDFIDEHLVSIKDRRLVHIQKTLNTQLGESLQAGLLNGDFGRATLYSINNDEAQFTVELNTPPPPALPLTVILALPRPKMLRRIIMNIAELGIKELYLINSYKVEKSYWQTPKLETSAIDTFLKEGLEQTKDTVLPKVYLKKLFKPFIEDELPTLIEGKEAFVAHPYTTTNVPSPSTNSRVMIIGPEGGFIDYEVNLIKEQGAHAISMGPRIYKVENALTLLSAQLSLPR
jgi:RsmE family RNA methyltransferase